MSNVIPISHALLQGRFVSEHSNLIWITADGRRMQLAFMATTHLFYAFRMLYDMIAAEQGWPLMRDKDKGMQADPNVSRTQVAHYMGAFATDILRRGDLPNDLRLQFIAMLTMLLQNTQALTLGWMTKQLLAGLKLVPAGKEPYDWSDQDGGGAA